MRKYIYFIGVISICLTLSGSFANAQDLGFDNDRTPCFPGALTSSIPFQGVAKGGELILAKSLNRNMRIAVIQTQMNEPAESVAERLAEYINTNDPFGWQIPKGFQAVAAEGGVLKCLLGGLIVAGTETGLGIPLPPHSLTCVYDAAQKVLMLFWENPPEGYDNISIVCNWSNFDHIGGASLPGDSTVHAFELDELPLNLDDLDIWVIGDRNGIRSNAAATHVSGNGKVQEELFGIPFTLGVSPNWQLWSYKTRTNRQSFSVHTENELTVAKGRRYNSVKTPDTKPFRQILSTSPQGGTVGIKRQFLGLVPGHNYRLSVRLNTLEMKPDSEGWEFSCHAIAVDSLNKPLSEEQLAGVTALPNDKTGDQAGKIAGYKPGATTKGQYITDTADITLPQECDSITVWLRLTAKSESTVAFDWIKLEDITKN